MCPQDWHLRLAKLPALFVVQQWRWMAARLVATPMQVHPRTVLKNDAFVANLAAS
jgi:hypothetical protein